MKKIISTILGVFIFSSGANAFDTSERSFADIRKKLNQFTVAQLSVGQSGVVWSLGLCNQGNKIFVFDGILGDGIYKITRLPGFKASLITDPKDYKDKPLTELSLYTMNNFLTLGGKECDQNKDYIIATELDPDFMLEVETVNGFSDYKSYAEDLFIRYKIKK